MPSYSYIVLTNPVEGQEDEYNRWYNEVHLKDVLAIPGFTGARRFRAAPELIAQGVVKWRYLAIYTIDTDNIEAAMAELVARAGTDAMVISPALDVGGAHAVAYLPIDAEETTSAT